jgi:hypothetical protein
MTVSLRAGAPKLERSLDRLSSRGSRVLPRCPGTR